MKLTGNEFMKENFERTIRVGLKRDPKSVFDEVESATAQIIRRGYLLRESFIEEGLGNIHLIFEREIINAETVDLKTTEVDN
jgi:hypothetical protein